VIPTTAPPPAGSLAEQVEGWAPGPQVRSDDLSRGPAMVLHGLLGPGAAAAPEASVPPLWHCGYFVAWTPLADLGPDGHPRGGGFLPPLADRRRVFAGGRVTFAAPLRFGVPATATSVLAATSVKSGRTGELLLVTVRTEIAQDGAVALTEEQDLIYRSGPAAGPGPAGAAAGPGAAGAAAAGGAAEAAGVRRAPFSAGPVMLFAFSALIANSHRIHYDLPYVQAAEGYPGLLVHGPLLAVVMAEQVRAHDPERPVRAMSYRFRQPLFAGEQASVTAAGGPAGTELAVLGPDGGVRASATVEFGPARPLDDDPVPDGGAP
jgi:hydroxyacyl-ACP dehydratase HTD2-like protein with hotdog domain